MFFDERLMNMRLIYIRNILQDSEGGTAIDTAQILEDKAMIVLLQGWTKSLPAEPR